MAYRALYRSYRPTKFSQVVGQQAIVKALRNQVRTGNIGHAYLFAGPRGIGKTSIAKLLAKAVNCQNPQDGEACGECTSCKSIEADGGVDILEVDAASNTRVDEIKSVLKNVNYYPSIGKYRVYIIDEIHMLSKHAFNSLLKTLEEPPAHVIFMLATTEPTALPDTILSRCQRYELGRIPTGLIAGHLESIAGDLKLNIDKKALLAIARSAEGGIRDALSLMDQCLALSGDTITASDVYSMLGSADSRYYFAMVDAIISQNIQRTISGISQMTEIGCEPVVIARELLRYFMDLLIVLNGSGSDLPMDESHLNILKKLSAKANNGTVLRILSLLSVLEGDMRYAKQPGILLELAAVKCCRTEKSDSYESLMERIEILEKKIESGIPAKQVVTEDDGYFDDFGHYVHTAKPATEEEEEPEIIEPVAVEPEIKEDTTEFFDESQLPPENYFGGDIIAPTVESNIEQTQQKQEEVKQEAPLPMFFDSDDTDDSPSTIKIVDNGELIAEINKEDAPAKKEQEDVPDDTAIIISDDMGIEPVDLWKQAATKLYEENKAMLSHFMQKGRAVNIKNNVLTVKWPPDASHIIEIVKTAQNTITINQALSAVAERKIHLNAEGEIMTKEETDFLTNALDDLKDLISDDSISIDYSDNNE